jgi:hypothetical protein
MHSSPLACRGTYLSCYVTNGWMEGGAGCQGQQMAAPVGACLRLAFTHSDGRPVRKRQ